MIENAINRRFKNSTFINHCENLNIYIPTNGQYFHKHHLRQPYQQPTSWPSLTLHLKPIEQCIHHRRSPHHHIPIRNIIYIIAAKSRIHFEWMPRNVCDFVSSLCTRSQSEIEQSKRELTCIEFYCRQVCLFLLRSWGDGWLHCVCVCLVCHHRVGFYITMNSWEAPPSGSASAAYTKSLGVV